MTGITQGWWVIAELQIVPSLPAAATTSTPLRAAWFNASERVSAALLDASPSETLKFSTQAPAPMQSPIAPASASGSALGTPPASLPLALKIGRTSNVHPGQIAGGRNWRDAHNIPATAVPWRQPALLANEHTSLGVAANSSTLAPAKPGWSFATGPSIKPMTTCALPSVTAISGASITCCNGSIVFIDVGATMSTRAFLRIYAIIWDSGPGAHARKCETV